MTRLGILIVGTLATLLLGIGPASAQQIVVDDPAGDTAPNDIDFTRVSLRNDDSTIVARLRLYHASSGGTLIVSVDPRQARGLRMVSEYDPVGHTTNYVVQGAFTDRWQSHELETCRAFRVRWSMQAPVVTLKMPSQCLHDGDYGALRFAVLTEDSDGGGDADWAPDESKSTAWVPRG